MAVLVFACLAGYASAQSVMTVTIAGRAGVRGSANGPAADARFMDPLGIAVDAAGNIFVADVNNFVIRKISATGTVTTHAGTAGFSGFTDGTGAAARFSSPEAMTIDAQGNLYLCEFGSTIRKITPAGVVTTLAGSFAQFGSVDGAGSQARFRAPGGIAVDGAGTLYVADTSNYQVRKVSTAGMVTTIAGSSLSNGSLGEPLDGIGINARFGSPKGIVVDPAGNLYVSDSGWRLIRKITPQGVVTTIAGNRNGGGFMDGAGTNALFGFPGAMALHPSGDIYVLEPEGQLIRKVTPAGVVTTLAGMAGLSGTADGLDRDVRFNWPGGLTIDGAGRFYIADTRNYTIRQRLPVFAPTFATQPRSLAVPQGGSAVFSLQAAGTPAATYQWRKNGVDIPGATSDTLSIDNLRATDSGAYSAIAANIAGVALSSAATLTVQPPPLIVSQPQNQSTAEGQTVVLSVAVTSDLTASYRWQRNGIDLPGATGATLTIPNAIPSTAASYSAIVTNAAGAVTTTPAMVTILSSRFANLSVRTTAGSGAATLIVGFVVAGTGKPLLVRGDGAILAQFGVPGALSDPRLTIYQGATVLATNDDWSSSVDAVQIAVVADRVGAFPLPSPSRDAAVLQTLTTGAFTAHVSAAEGASGISLAELYDANVTGEGRLVNLSARAHVGTGDNSLIAGFVIAGNTRKRVLVRGIGPSLAGFGVTGALSDPRVTVYQNGIAIIAANDDWAGDAAISAAASQAGAFPLASNSKDAALILSLDAGAYSAQVTGAGTTTGAALVEVYEIP